MDKPSILLQFDTDPQPSVFDGVVAVDAGIEQVFRHGGVSPANVRELVHGAIFTRGWRDLHRTAIFIGGANVGAGEELMLAITKTFFGPQRVSVMLDANGANTTAAAALLAAAKHLDLSQTTALVLGGTGPVGQRVVRLLAGQGAQVRVASRELQRAQATCAAVRIKLPNAHLEPVATLPLESLLVALDGVQLVIAAGAPGIVLLPMEIREKANKLQVAIDLNAVPPLGIAGVEVFDNAEDRDGIACYGAVGVGSTKMKIHKASLKRLFETNELVLDAEEILVIGQQLS